MFKSILNFFKSTIEELRQIEWLDRKSHVKYTYMVLAFVVIFSFAIGILDVGLIKTRTITVTCLNTDEYSNAWECLKAEISEKEETTTVTQQPQVEVVEPEITTTESETTQTPEQATPSETPTQQEVTTPN